MAGAAIPLDEEAYDATIPRPMGRNSAGAGFMRAWLRYADVDRIYLWNLYNRAEADLEPLLQRLGPPCRPATWIAATDRAGLGLPGAVHIPTPELQGQAWARRAVGGTHYSITGVTHTIAETYIMGQIAGLLVAPVEPWDALVCTSNAVRAAVQTQLEAVAEHFRERLGATRIAPAQLVTIPLGVHCDDFAFDGEARAAWRAQLNIPPEALVALHFGRFSPETKMNPGPMGLALQGAARRVDRPVYWLLFGGARERETDARFRAAAADFCPDVTLRFAGELAPDAFGSIWSAADVFLSFSDNVQESFGLTVLEAMAAGLPSVISDWNGYRDTLRHGIDGFRIRTVTPRPGLGADLAYRYAHGLSTYGAYAAAVAQLTAVDIPSAVEALAALFAEPDLRRRMGRAAQARAREIYDWRVVITQYQALWSELERRRHAAPVQPPGGAGDNPWGLDPFRMFAAYPTEILSHAHTVTLRRSISPKALSALLAKESVRMGSPHLLAPDETRALIAALSIDRPQSVAGLIAAFPPESRARLERGLVWLAKFDVIALSGSGPTR